MATKKLYFYSVNLLDSEGKVCNYKKVAEILKKIIEHNSVEQGEYKTLDLTDNIYEHIVWDVYEYADNKFFGRISKQKPSNSLVGRNYLDLKKKDINRSSDERVSGIEQYTYGNFDYETGIFMIVGQMGAPTELAFSDIFKRYCKNYVLELLPISNPRSIDILYNAKKPEISSVEIEIPLPSLSILQNALEWNDKEVTDNLEKRKMTAKIIVKAEGRKQLLSDKESITKGLLNMINNKMPRYKKAKARAKTESTNMREYDFFEKHFSYTIDIVNYHIENYERVYYTVDELMDIYKKNIIMAFAENKKILLTLANR